MEATLRSDKRKHPQVYTYRLLTEDECRALPKGSRVDVLDDNGKIAAVKVTLIKTWKRKADVEIHWKFGQFYFGTTTISQDQPNTFFVHAEVKE